MKRWLSSLPQEQQLIYRAYVLPWPSDPQELSQLRSARYGVIIAIITGVISAITIGGSDFLALRPGSHEVFITNVMSQLPGFYPSTGHDFWTWASVAVLFEALTSGATLALTAGLYYGGRVYVQHFVLRFLLWWRRSVPFNYPRFLDYAAERILLHKVGGGYIFIHRLLLEHFASLEEKPNPSKSGAYFL